MSIHVTKWVACFNYDGDELKVIEARFHKTAKLYILAEDYPYLVYKALSYGRRFAQDDWRLSDSPEAALAAMSQREERHLEQAVEKVKAAKARLALIAMKQAEYAE